MWVLMMMVVVVCIVCVCAAAGQLRVHPDNPRWMADGSGRAIYLAGSHNMCVADVGNTGYPDLIGANWSGDYQPVEMWRNLLGEGG